MLKHKRVLKLAFSDCLKPVKDGLGNVPLGMHTSKLITASILGICRAYEQTQQLSKADFDLLVDAVFEDIFRRESVKVQLLTESWLQQADSDFLAYYYKAKANANNDPDLSWLQYLALENFQQAETVVFPL